MAAYIVSLCTITDFHDNLKKYITLSEDLIKEYGGEYVIRGPAAKVLEGDALQGPSLIITKFESMDKAKAFYESNYYQKEVKPLRAQSGIYEIGVYDEAPS